METTTKGTPAETVTQENRTKKMAHPGTVSGSVVFHGSSPTGVTPTIAVEMRLRRPDGPMFAGPYNADGFSEVEKMLNMKSKALWGMKFTLVNPKTGLPDVQYTHQTYRSEAQNLYKDLYGEEGFVIKTARKKYEEVKTAQANTETPTIKFTITAILFVIVVHSKIQNI